MNNKSCMKLYCGKSFRPSALFVGIFLGLCLPGFAAELGKASGTPILGRALDVTIPITLDAPADEPCAEVQAYFGESRVKTADFWITTDSPQVGRLKITSAQPVDEPVVTLYVSVACGGQMSRKYVFLTELVMEAAPVALVLPTTVPGGDGRSSSPTAPAVTAAKPDAPVSGSSDGASLGQQAGVTKKPVARAKPRAIATTGEPSLPAAAGSSVPSKAKLAAPAGQAAAGEAGPKSRLKLEPLALLESPVPALKSSGELSIASPATAASREAAAATWKTANQTPDELAKEKNKLQSLETQFGQMEARFLAQQEQLQKFQAEADSQKFQNRILMALLVLLGAAAFFIYRSSRQSAVSETWWGSPKRDAQSGDEDESSQTGQKRDAMADAATELPAETGASQPEPGLSAVQSGADHVVTPPLADNPVSQLQKLGKSTDSLFAPLMSSKSYDVQELFDVQEQAEFFNSVGQYHRAVDVLKEHVRQNPEVSALAYLDLFSLYHRLDKKKEYEELIGKFNAQFSVEVPKFEEYGTAGVKHLEDYPDALNKIMDLWPHESALDAIAEFIFTKPVEGQAPFSLEAYRELLMLYAILRDEREGGVSDELFQHASGPQTDSQDKPVSLDFWASADDRVLESKQVADIYKPKGSNKLGLDIDLSGADKSKK